MKRFFVIFLLFFGYLGHLLLGGAFYLCAELFFPSVFLFPLVYLAVSFLYGYFLTPYTRDPNKTTLYHFASYLVYWVTVFLIAVIGEGEYNTAVFPDGIFALVVLLVTLFSSRLWMTFHKHRED